MKLHWIHTVGERFNNINHMACKTLGLQYGSTLAILAPFMLLTLMWCIALSFSFAETYLLVMLSVCVLSLVCLHPRPLKYGQRIWVKVFVQDSEKWKIRTLSIQWSIHSWLLMGLGPVQLLFWLLATIRQGPGHFTCQVVMSSRNSGTPGHTLLNEAKMGECEHYVK